MSNIRHKFWGKLKPVRFEFSTLELTSVHIFKIIWWDFDLGTIFALIFFQRFSNDWFKLLKPNVTCSSLLLTGYPWLLQFTSGYLWLPLVASGSLVTTALNNFVIRIIAPWCFLEYQRQFLKYMFLINSAKIMWRIRVNLKLTFDVVF